MGRIIIIIRTRFLTMKEYNDGANLAYDAPGESLVIFCVEYERSWESHLGDIKDVEGTVWSFHRGYASDLVGGAFLLDDNGDTLLFLRFDVTRVLFLLNFRCRCNLPGKDEIIQVSKGSPRRLPWTLYLGPAGALER